MSTSLSHYDGWTVESIVARNSHELTAMHVLQAREFIVEQRARHEVEIAAYKALITETNRIGNRVLVAKSSGRKTVRIADLTEETPDVHP